MRGPRGDRWLYLGLSPLPPTHLPSLDPKDKIDIGLPPPKVCRTQQLLERKRVLRELRARVEEERAARLRTGKPSQGRGPGCVPTPPSRPDWHPPFPGRIPLEAVRAEWERTCGPYHKQRLAEYYGLYRDLFHGATFVPRVPLHVAYAMGEDELVPVYHGNEVTPTEVSAGLCPVPPCVDRHTPVGGKDRPLLKAFTEEVFMVVEGTTLAEVWSESEFCCPVASPRFPSEQHPDNYQREEHKMKEKAAAPWPAARHLQGAPHPRLLPRGPSGGSALLRGNSAQFLLEVSLCWAASGGAVKDVWIRVGSAFSRAPSDPCSPESSLSNSRLPLLGVTAPPPSPVRLPRPQR